MKVVQVGILIALIVVGVLLFQLNKRQRSPAETPAPQPAETAEQAPVAEPPDVPVEAPPPKAAAKPSPAAKPPSRPARTTETAKIETPAVQPPAEAFVPAPPPEPPPVAASATEPSPVAPVVPPPPPPPRTVTVAAGTLLPVRLAETLSTEQVKEGDTFAATLERPLVVDGLVVAERGARVEGRVVEAVSKK